MSLIYTSHCKPAGVWTRSSEAHPEIATDLESYPWCGLESPASLENCTGFQSTTFLKPHRIKSSDKENNVMIIHDHILIRFIPRLTVISLNKDSMMPLGCFYSPSPYLLLLELRNVRPSGCDLWFSSFLLFSTFRSHGL